MILDVTRAGAGDAVVCCWIAQGSRDAGSGEIAIRAGRHSDLVRMFGQTVCECGDDEPDVIQIGGHSEVYRYQLSIGGGDDPVPVTWQRRMPLWPRVTPRQPPHVLESSEVLWADGEIAAHGHAPAAMLFPHAAWGPRAWPVAYFIDVAWRLHEDGWTVWAASDKRDDLDKFPYFLLGQSWRRLAALAMRCDVVLCNESGPAHVCGTLGVPTVVACGPTRPESNLAHMPAVTPVTVEKAKSPCVGCHFRGERGYRAACDAQCRSLMLLEPESVLATIDGVIGGNRGPAHAHRSVGQAGERGGDVILAGACL